MADVNKPLTGKQVKRMFEAMDEAKANAAFAAILAKEREAIHSETKHTPGPWVVYQPPYSEQMQVRDEAKEIVIAAVPKKGDAFRCRADANLIAAAPELLEALREAENALEACGLHLHDAEKHDAGNGAYAVAVRARAAIAKAEGKE